MVNSLCAVCVMHYYHMDKNRVVLHVVVTFLKEKLDLVKFQRE